MRINKLKEMFWSMEKKTSSKKKEAGKMEERPFSTVAQDGNASGTKKN